MKRLYSSGSQKKNRQK